MLPNGLSDGNFWGLKNTFMSFCHKFSSGTDIEK